MVKSGDIENVSYGKYGVKSADTPDSPDTGGPNSSRSVSSVSSVSVIGAPDDYDRLVEERQAELEGALENDWRDHPLSCECEECL